MNSNKKKLLAAAAISGFMILLNADPVLANDETGEVQRVDYSTDDFSDTPTVDDEVSNDVTGGGDVATVPETPNAADADVDGEEGIVIDTEVNDNLTPPDVFAQAPTVANVAAPAPAAASVYNNQAVLGSSGLAYNTIDEAVRNAKANDSIKIYGTVQLNTTVNINQSLSIDAGNDNALIYGIGSTSNFYLNAMDGQVAFGSSDNLSKLLLKNIRFVVDNGHLTLNQNVVVNNEEKNGAYVTGIKNPGFVVTVNNGGICSVDGLTIEGSYSYQSGHVGVNVNGIQVNEGGQVDYVRNANLRLGQKGIYVNGGKVGDIVNTNIYAGEDSAIYVSKGEIGLIDGGTYYGGFEVIGVGHSVLGSEGVAAERWNDEFINNIDPSYAVIGEIRSGIFRTLTDYGMSVILHNFGTVREITGGTFGNYSATGARNGMGIANEIGAVIGTISGGSFYGEKYGVINYGEIQKIISNSEGGPTFGYLPDERVTHVDLGDRDWAPVACYGLINWSDDDLLYVVSKDVDYTNWQDSYVTLRNVTTVKAGGRIGDILGGTFYGTINGVANRGQIATIGGDSIFMGELAGLSNTDVYHAWDDQLKHGFASSSLTDEQRAAFFTLLYRAELENNKTVNELAHGHIGSITGGTFIGEVGMRNEYAFIDSITGGTFWGTKGASILYNSELVGSDVDQLLPEHLKFHDQIEIKTKIEEGLDELQGSINFIFVGGNAMDGTVNCIVLPEKYSVSGDVRDLFEVDEEADQDVKDYFHYVYFNKKDGTAKTVKIYQDGIDRLMPSYELYKQIVEDPQSYKKDQLEQLDKQFQDPDIYNDQKEMLQNMIDETYEDINGGIEEYVGEAEGAYEEWQASLENLKADYRKEYDQMYDLEAMKEEPKEIWEDFYDDELDLELESMYYSYYGSAHYEYKYFKKELTTIFNNKEEYAQVLEELREEFGFTLEDEDSFDEFFNAYMDLIARIRIDEYWEEAEWEDEKPVLTVRNAKDMFHLYMVAYFHCDIEFNDNPEEFVSAYFKQFTGVEYKEGITEEEFVKAWLLANKGIDLDSIESFEDFCSRRMAEDGINPDKSKEEFVDEYLMENYGISLESYNQGYEAFRDNFIPDFILNEESGRAEYGEIYKSLMAEQGLDWFDAYIEITKIVYDAQFDEMYESQRDYYVEMYEKLKAEIETYTAERDKYQEILDYYQALEHEGFKNNDNAHYLTIGQKRVVISVQQADGSYLQHEFDVVRDAIDSEFTVNVGNYEIPAEFLVLKDHKDHLHLSNTDVDDDGNITMMVGEGVIATLNLKYDLNHYTLTYDLGYTPEEAAPARVTFSRKAKAGNPYSPVEHLYSNIWVVSPNPEREHFGFVRWLSSDGKSYVAGDQIVADHDITLTAVWERLYSLVVEVMDKDGNYQFEKEDRDAYKGGIGETVSTSAAERKGFILSPKSVLKEVLDERTGEIKLVVVYDRVPYTVTYDTAGGSKVENETALFENLFTIAGKPERDGFEFVGWFDKDGKEYTTKQQVFADRNIDLSAKWKAIPVDEPVVKPSEEPVVTPEEKPVVTPEEKPAATPVNNPVTRAQNSLVVGGTVAKAEFQTPSGQSLLADEEDTAVESYVATGVSGIGAAIAALFLNRRKKQK